ncbi:catecholate siderophore receptor [Paracoccus sanguinis]|uniref:Catecholate siderophore receptor n=2 Tax=Paracoccus sanguinis TaxID=1545044 RepID=A0A1H3A9Q7_9RHOB|nr:catecholate siderophore receptor [Paracoccus sanguinis]
MPPISPSSLRPLLCGAGASFGALVATGIPHPALAQDGAAAEPMPDGVVQLDTVVLTASDEASLNTNAANTGIARLPGTVRETPKVVTVVPAEIIPQQAATTLQEALRNVPGITLSTGEGRGGSSGDQFRIRGLAAQGDVYQDGLRDFGVYTRDSFNTEGVQVIKGPSGDSFGVGNLGGLINQQRKKAGLEAFSELQGSASTGATQRLQYDTNRVIGDTEALRLNVMVQNGEAADRDRVTDDRLGLTVDYGRGLGTGTQWHLGYSYLRNRGVPDMGQPMGEAADGRLRPLLEFDVPGYDRDISYVRSTDRDDADVHMVTWSLTHELDGGWTLSNDTRVTRYARDFSATNPALCDAACVAGLRAGIDQPLRYGAGGGMTYDQQGWGVQNVTTLKGEAVTGGIRHQVTAGLDLSWQIDHRRRGAWLVARPEGTILDPVFDARDAVFAWDDRDSTAKALNAGLFLADRMHFGDQVSVLASARADWFESSFDGTLIGGTSPVSGSIDGFEISPSLSLIWEPTPDRMAYLTFARTYRPLGTDIAAAANAFETEVPASDRDFAPERSDLIELGGKIDVLDHRLGLTAALFQIDKRNSFDRDPTTGEITPGFSANGENRRIRGLELGASGEVAPGVDLLLAYSNLDGEITGGRGADAAKVGRDAPGVPRHNLALWASHARPVGTGGGEVTVAGGVRYASDYWSDSANAARIPETVSVDMMLAYEQDNWRVALNGTNLTDHRNYASAFSGSRVEPEAGRVFTLSLSQRF